MTQGWGSSIEGLGLDIGNERHGFDVFSLDQFPMSVLLSSLFPSFSSVCMFCSLTGRGACISLQAPGGGSLLPNLRPKRNMLFIILHRVFAPTTTGVEAIIDPRQTTLVTRLMNQATDVSPYLPFSEFIFLSCHFVSQPDSQDLAVDFIVLFSSLVDYTASFQITFPIIQTSDSTITFVRVTANTLLNSISGKREMRCRTE